MPNYLERNWGSLLKFHYLLHAANDYARVDWHLKTLEKVYKKNHGYDFCIGCCGDPELDDCYIIPFSVVQNIFIHDNLCVEGNAVNLAINRERWRFSIVRHELKLWKNTRSGNLVPTLDVSRFYNKYEYLGIQTALDVEPFPIKLNPADRPVRPRLFEDPKPKSVNNKNQMGDLYFILNTTEGTIKIGWSGVSVESRLKAFQTGNSSPLRVIATIPALKGEEEVFLRHFSGDRVKGGGKEWFKPDNILKFLNGGISLPTEDGVNTAVRIRPPPPISVGY